MTNARFAGFADRVGFLPVPAPLLGPLMQEIDTLAELKLVLHIWRRLHETRRTPRYVLLSELRADRGLLLGLQTEADNDPHAALGDALAAAVDRGVYLRMDLTMNGQSDSCLMLNTPANRRLADRIKLGEVRIAELGRPVSPATPAEPRPSIYQLYEDNIGLLTPLLAQELREAELTYPPDWVEDAFREAVGYNKRSWRYVRRILENWGANGRGAEPVGEPRRDTQPPRDSGAYLSGRYGKYIKH